ncbi:MAG: M67 family metallopeptidase [Candidatus Margulisiibacteriota bacterium]|jgi:proteasome lid subunit RPN8/RPN11
MKINEQVLRDIVRHGEKERPLEACGYLAGKEGVLSVYYPMTNLDKSAEHYSLDPKEQFAVLKEVRQRGLSILGIAHTHPHSPARPSAEDIKLAYDPQLLYLIVSLAGEQPVAKGFWIRSGEVSTENLDKEQ